MLRVVRMVFALSAVTGGALAQESVAPPKPAAPPAPAAGARTHDGFYLRLGLGGGVLKGEFSGGNQPDATADGGAVLLDILIGGTLARGLVLGGGYHIAAASEVDFEVGTTYSGSGGALGQGIVGPFIDFFPWPDQGFDVGLLGGLAIVSMDTPKILGQGVSLDHRGLGVSPFVGYTLWLADEWSMGLTLRATWTSTQDDDGSGQDGVSRTLGATLTAQFH